MEYLESANIYPFADENKAKQQIIDFGKSLNKETKEKQEKREKEIKEEREKERKEECRRAEKALEILNDFVHNHFNNVLNDNNSRLYYLGLVDYADWYLDDIRFRATNCLCTTLNPEKHKNDAFADITKRYNMLMEIGIENPTENDVNGSIYRLTYNLSHSFQLSQNVDIYEMFWQAAGFKQEFTRDARNSLKVACMPIYMKEYTIDNSVYNYNKYRRKKMIIFDKQKKERMVAYKYLVEHTNLELAEILTKIAQAMHEVLGVDNFYGKDIFLYESDLHAEMKSKLLDMGIVVLNCYDGFYGEKGVFTEEIFYSVYYNAIEELKKYICIRDGITQKELPSYLDDEYFAA